MLAIDTNVIVRFLVGDHPAQSAAARRLIESSDIFVPVTVLLEVGWVLRGTYGYRPTEIVAAIRAFGGLPRTTIEDAAAIALALDWVEARMDFADALHLAKAGSCDAFVSFDRHLAKASDRIGSTEVRLLDGSSTN